MGGDTPAPILRLGLLGLSEGNGHPYSWSAICNGYDPEVMASCPFPVIPAYLSRQRFPEDRLPGVQVTHVWTQDGAVSAHIAAAARIPHVVAEAADMIPHVDAILLARDDAEHHLAMSLPFLEAGLPVYIDKPIALRVADLERLYAAQQYDGQIFSCSALRFAPSLRLEEEAAARIGTVRHVDAVVPKTWTKYGVHIVDSVLANLGLYGQDCRVTARALSGVHVVTAQFETLSAVFTSLGELPGEIRLRYYGTSAFADRVFDDTFVAFRIALRQFIGGVTTRREVTTRAELLSVVRILEAGLDTGD